MLADCQCFLTTKYPYLIRSIHSLAFVNLVEGLGFSMGPMCSVQRFSISNLENRHITMWFGFQFVQSCNTEVGDTDDNCCALEWVVMCKYFRVGRQFRNSLTF